MTVYNLFTKCKRMFEHENMRNHNDVIKCIRITLCNKRN